MCIRDRDNSTIETNSDVLRVKDAGITAAKLNVTAHKFTATAQAAIEASGGTATNL